MKKRYYLYSPKGCFTPQVRDREMEAINGSGVVCVMPTLGGQYSTRQMPKEAEKLARKIIKSLNQP